MRCRRIRRSMLEAELGRLAPGEAAAVERHVRTCPACAARVRAERPLIADLRRLAVEPPFEVEVTATVRRRLAGLPAPRRPEVSARDVGRAAAAAAVVAAALLVASWGLAPQVVRSAHEVWIALAGVGRAAQVLVAPLAGLTALGVRVAIGLLESATALGSTLVRFAPALEILAGVLVAVMLATATWFVGRDLLPRER